MTTLYIDEKHLQLTSHRDVLEIRKPQQEEVQRIPLHLLSTLIISSNITLTSLLIRKLTANNVRLVVIDPKQKGTNAITQWSHHGNHQRRRQQILTFYQADLCLPLVTECLASKTTQQIKTIHSLETEKSTHQTHKILTPLKNLQKQLTDHDQHSTITTIDTTLGLEGGGSKLYFQWMQSWLPTHLGFRGRQKRPPKDPVNACLSLGYTLLYHQAACVSSTLGLDPAFGFFHQPAYNRLSLACDLMEPLRPHLDQWILQLFNQRHLQLNHFHTQQNEACLLGKSGRQLFYQNYESYRYFYQRYLRQYCYHLIRQIE